MIQQLSPSLGLASDASDTRPRGFQPTARVAVAVLVLLLATNGPLFVCMPLTTDTALYDLQAQTLRQGGVLYRDILEPNLPGVVWIHAAVRSVLGTSSEAMRLFDLAAFAVIVWLLTRWLAAGRCSTAVQAWSAFALFLFYFSISEWNHCQRDMWLLAPALVGLHLRRRQTLRDAAETSPRAWLAWAALEGAVWGSAIWLKPMVVVPLAAVWLFSTLATRRQGGWRRSLGDAPATWRLRAILDAAGLLAGGLTVGALGVAWLGWSGAWPWFWETFTEWNPRYFEAGKEHWTADRFVGTVYRLLPWSLLHLAAAPCAVLGLGAWLRGRHARDLHGEQTSQSLLCVFYLAWLVQSLFLQHLFDYVHAPGVLLAVTLLCHVLFSNRAASGLPDPATADLQNKPPRGLAWRFAAIGFLTVAFLASPVLHADRLSVWPACWTHGSTPEVRNRLSFFKYPNWEDLHDAANYLRQQNPSDGEVTCYNNNLVYLYEALDLRPSTRFVYLEALLIYFPERHAEIRAALDASRQRYLVTDLTAAGLHGDAVRSGTQGENGSLPPAFSPALRRHFPWSYPVAYRAGSIVVHRVPPRTAP